MDGANDRLDLVTLCNFSSLGENKICEFLGEGSVIFAKILYHVEFSREFDHFLHESIVSHALLFSL